MRLFTLIFCALLAALPAFGDELPSAPGWSLSKIGDSGQEDNVVNYGNQRVFYSLKPPDARPAISVDSGTADRLRSGQAAAEATYSGQGAGGKKEDEEFVYGNHGNGIQMADTVNSTLTGEEGRKDVDLTAVNAHAANANNSGGSLAAGMGSGSSNSGRNVAAKALSMAGSPHPAVPSAANATGASSPAPAAAAAADPSVDPRQIASANGATIAAPTPPSSMLVANNVASGFGMTTGSGTSTSFSIWPNGDPATMTATSSGTSTGTSTATATKGVCSAATLVFSAATLQRFTIPSGCTGVKIDAFGAGGGSGSPALNGADPLSVQAADGGGGAFVHGEGAVDGVTYDLVVVVGSPGGDAKNGVAGEAGFIGGGGGGTGGGGGGGGYSGIFLVDKARFHTGEMPQLPEKALVVAAGGGGGSATGGAGGPGGAATGGGDLGASQMDGGPKQGNGIKGWTLGGGAGGELGGGGGGGFFGGGGGGSTDADTPAFGGGGGSSFFSLPAATSLMTAATGSTAGNGSYKDRKHAGDAGKTGLVVVTFY